MTHAFATAADSPRSSDGGSVLAGSWVAAALLVGVTSLGLPWGPLGEPGYVGAARVPVVAAGVLVVLGWRRRSRPLVRLGSAFGLGAVVLAGFQGGGALAMLVAVLLLELPLRRSGPFSRLSERTIPAAAALSPTMAPCLSAMSGGGLP